jgi:brefeldin A-inhibited guanine nucleotide-exchange protein 3
MMNLFFRLFEEAANNLNMTSLTAFLASLCESSKHQLHKITRTIMEEEEYPGEHHNLPVNSLHLYRLQNVLMKVVHSDRPLIHLIKAWSVVSSYLVEVRFLTGTFLHCRVSFSNCLIKACKKL